MLKFINVDPADQSHFQHSPKEESDDNSNNNNSFNGGFSFTGHMEIARASSDGDISPLYIPPALPQMPASTARPPTMPTASTTSAGGNNASSSASSRSKALKEPKSIAAV